MAKIIIGGEAAEGDLGNFDKLERAWPHIVAAQEATDQMAQMSAMVAVLSVSINEEVAAVKKRLKPREMGAIGPFFRQLLEEAQVTGEG